MSRFYVTTPIYYVNDLPHIGHIYTTVVCDAIARYRRLRGDDVRFLTGTDEHGQKIEQAAREAALAPIELANRVVDRYHELWQRLGISKDDFVRTTEPRHRRGVEALKQACLAGLEPQLLETQAVRYHCRCSRERLLGHLLGLSEEQLEELDIGSEVAQAECGFCGEVYFFQPSELRPQ